MQTNALQAKEGRKIAKIVAIMAKRRSLPPVENHPEPQKPAYPSRAKLAYAAILREQFDKLTILSSVTERSVSFYARKAVDLILATGNPDLVCTVSPDTLAKGVAAMMKVLENE